MYNVLIEIMKRSLQLSLITLSLFFINPIFAQEYSFEDFVGTWNGTIVSETQGYNINTTIVIEADGSYTESSGTLMPTLYPNTQWCEYDLATNRFSFNWLGTVWGGISFYDYTFYEVVTFENGTLEMHYNYWDDPEPHPQVQTISLLKEGTVTSIEDEFQSPSSSRKLVRVFDLMGREVSPDIKGQVLIYQYDDGSVEKKSIIAH